MNAFHGDANLKAAMLIEMAWHREQDKIIKGTYGKGSNGDWRGSSVGCAIHSLMRLRHTKLDTGDHSLLETHLNIPEHLWHLNDAIFEALPLHLAKEWPGRFLEAIPVGADLSMTQVHFMYWLLSDESDGVIRFAGKYADIKAAIENVTGLLAKVIGGVPVTKDQWSAARSAARIKQSEKLLQLLSEAPVLEVVA